ncbi:zinc-binding dehydrogenase [Arthrobacter sp. M4]|uniref:zinc-binding dehydrogenase n=1 Tax=Arthrobacter sp. M4 TaxID=218160 RepID=UPI001CDCC60B|nr:alcohol dehydrogenase catalytic domain-containing protein [Arthrobacter sp. M4]MCA4132520.1 alcohol dehydrogenase catalytic domain-containing protein [Arthrobacter sp. M4]
MRATLIYGPGDVRVEEAADPVIEQPTDAIVRVVLSCVCGGDLHSYRSWANGEPKRMGHEVIGAVEETGADVRLLKRGDLVLAPFTYQDGTCPFCRAGRSTSCVNGGYWSRFNGGQGELVRIPLADTSLFQLPVGEDSELLPSLLTLSDVYGTGFHAALKGGVTYGSRVTVIGDGAVGLLAVLSAKQLGAEQIILMGRHAARTELGRTFGATDIITERGAEGVSRVRELTGGLGTEIVLEAVGHMPASEQAIGAVRSDGTISRVGVPQYEQVPVGNASLFDRNITLTGGVAHVASYVKRLMPAILDGTVNPGLVFDRTINLDEMAEGYRAMDAREALKVLVRP